MSKDTFFGIFIMFLKQQTILNKAIHIPHQISQIQHIQIE